MVFDMATGWLGTRRGPPAWMSATGSRSWPGPCGASRRPSALRRADEIIPPAAAKILTQALWSREHPSRANTGNVLVLYNFATRSGRTP